MRLLDPYNEAVREVRRLLRNHKRSPRKRAFCYDVYMNHESIRLDKHLRLVQLRPDQADRLFELTDRNRTYLGEFLPWVPLVKTVDDSRKHIHETLENREKGTAYTYAMELDGKVVGDVSLRNIDDAARPPEIGYWVSPDHSGKGLTTRAVKALTDLGINSLGLDKIVIKANPENVASNKVAEKAGYTLVGHESEDNEELNVWSINKP